MTYWVIREGLVRGEGRYMMSTDAGGLWTESRELAGRYDSPNDIAWSKDSERLVRVTRKPRTTTLEAFEAGLGAKLDGVVTLDHHLASVKQAREAALEEAKRECRLLSIALTTVNEVDKADACVACADAIAALRSK